MKRLLIILLTLFSLTASAQITDTVRLKIHGGSGGGISESKIAQMISDSLATLDLSGYTKAQVDSIATVIRGEITSGGVTQAQLNDSTAAIRNDFPTVSGVNQAQLDDTATAIRGAIPDTSNLVKKNTYFPLGLVAPLYPVDSFTAGVDSLYILKRVPTVSTLQSDTSKATMIMVTDTLQGGIFIYSTAANTVDNGVVFAATGKGSGYWVRQYDKSRGVNVDWWGTRTEVSINKAVTAAGINGIINFTPDRTYIQHGRILPLQGQLLNGYGAVLQRGNDSVVTTTTITNITDSFIVVNAVPSFWTTSAGYIHIFTDTTDFSGSANLSIKSISGDTVYLKSAVGGLYTPDATHTQITQWSIGAKVHLSYTQIDDNGFFRNFSIKNLIFDGNVANNNANHSWRINTTILLRGNGGQPEISGCSFLNIPNENIMGHGFKIVGNYAHNTNGSFVHLTAVYNNNPSQIPAIITGNVTDSTNQITDAVGGHSEGVITFSNTSGYANISNNRFKNGGDAVFGAIRSGTLTDGGTRNLIINSNYAENFNKIFYNTNFPDPTGSTYKFGHIYISNNSFNNCGTTDWTSFQTNIDKGDTIMIANNFTIGGTVWKIPVQNSDSLQRYILNNSTTTAQKAAINISGAVSAAVIKKIGGTSSQFLKADGSADATSYATDASVMHLGGSETVTGIKTHTTYSAYPSGLIIGNGGSFLYISSTTYGYISTRDATVNSGMSWEGPSDATFRNIQFRLHNSAGSYVVKGAGNQSAPIVSIRDSSNNELASINSVGMFANEGSNVASATSITPTGNVFHVTGTTNITSLTATNIKAGTSMKIIFDGVLTLTDGNNLKLAGNFTTSADATITLVYDGTNFYETSRSTN